jgi:hypothetical protein
MSGIAAARYRRWLERDGGWKEVNSFLGHRVMFCFS